LQLWIFPDKKGHEPRYDQKSFNPNERRNRILTIVSPSKSNGNLWLNQDTYFSMTDLDKNKSVNYKIHSNGSGIYLFVIEGEISVGDEKLLKRDGIGVSDTEELILKAEDDSRVLIIEVPMK
jgi:redox-sensitive bicupin YhaK (pirin superfamily)